MAKIILTMSPDVMAAPTPGSPETGPVLTEGARCDRGPSAATRQGVQGKAVFTDFGKGKVFALSDDCDEVLVFNNLPEMVERLKPQMVVLDSLPNKLQTVTAELARTGITFLKLKDMRKIAEERSSNGVVKSDENDAKLLKTIYCRCPELFQLLFTSPEELVVRELTEEWVTFAYMRRVAKQNRTAANHPLVIENHKNLQKMVIKLSEEIHAEAVKLPLYRLVFERLGLKGPAIAYLISHDGWALETLPREKLTLRFQMTGRRKHRRRSIRSRLLILLAMSTVLNKHPRYYGIYQKYVEKHSDKPGRRRHWKAVLQLSQRILRDIHKLAKANRCQTPDT